MPERECNNRAITANLLLVVCLWGGNNAATKWLVASWPPVFTGENRFLAAGLILLAVLRLTTWLGEFHPLNSAQYRQLWLRGGLSLAAYTVFFSWALRLSPASHVALYIGASPVWTLLMEDYLQWGSGPEARNAKSKIWRYAAALLALAGVGVLFWPAFKHSSFNLSGEGCGLAASLCWANYNHQSRILSRAIHGLEIAANAMWMSAVLLAPLAVWEIWRHGVKLDAAHVGIQSLAVVFGGVVPYALWNSALRHWQTSRVMLFNNFLPLSTAAWAYFTLEEPITPTFFTAMLLVVSGVALGQRDGTKTFRAPRPRPPESLIEIANHPKWKALLRYDANCNRHCAIWLLRKLLFAEPLQIFSIPPARDMQNPYNPGGGVVGGSASFPGVFIRSLNCEAE